MSDKEIQVLEKKANPLITKSEKFKEIKDENDMKVATTLLSEMNRFSDHIEEQKNKLLRPALDTVAAIRKQYKPVEDMFKPAIAMLRTAMSKYQTAATAIADKKKDDIANRVGPGKGKLKAETAMQKIDEVDAPERTVSTEAGAVRFDTVKHFEVIDLSKVPVKYLLPNETMIRAAMKRDEALPGVRYYTTQEPRNLR